MKIFYTKGQREDPVASLATLKKILARFVRHYVFYEMSARHRRTRQLFSVKNVFLLGQVDVSGQSELVVTLFDADHPAHSIEIVNPHALRIYDEGKSYAVAFYTEEEGEFDVRYYLRDEGEEGKGPKRSALERISLPQLFEYLEDVKKADVVEVLEPSKR
ncbi:MAG TPA: hypothetical protein VGX02_07415 [Candidatus Eremiobacteraceae bacterium]|nr:hypothetical protein [Candidatus Eremiobacteraceae bacterium]